MKAAVIYGPRDIRVESVEDPSIRKDEILVKVRACGICGTDLHTYKTGGTATPEKPVILGHEFSGEIVEMGSSVEGLKKGDRVLGTGLRSCGQCHWCRLGQTFRCPNPALPGEGLDGAFAEYVVVPNPAPGRTLFNLPDDMSWEEAAVVEPTAVACYAVRRADIQPDQKVVILGAGMIGLGVVQVCKALGVSKLIVSEPQSARLAVAEKLGAHVTINPQERDPIEAVKEATTEEMADVVFECSGSPVAFCQAPLMIRPFGRIILVGIFEEKVELSPELMTLMFQFRNLTLRGSGGDRWDTALELVRTGQVKIADLITHEFPLDSASEAFETQLNLDKAIKVLIKP